MKLFFSLLTVMMVAWSCKNATGSKIATRSSTEAGTDTASYTSIEWIDSLKDVGNIRSGETVNINFKFKNTGTYPLFVIAAQPGCGCTVTDFPKEAIAPGDEGTISAAFDTNKGHEGVFRKNINVTTNTKGNTSQILYFTGTIVKGGSSDSSQAKAGGA
jgi:hypothetical protein